MGTLFDLGPAFDRESFRLRLRELAEKGMYIGGSSWKYEGWLDQIYTRQLYRAGGRFSKKLFEQTCLEEYATVFPTVCGDFAFYQFPAAEFWKKLFAQTPAGFQFAFKVPEQITSRVFPARGPYRAQAGQDNPFFLHADLFKEEFLALLEPYRDKTAVLILEFTAFSPASFRGASDFLDLLDPFLASLPPDFRYGVEIRNAGFLVPEYFACLRAHKAAHVFNAWTRMPLLHQQMALPGSRTADFTVTRALLKHGRTYEDAVREFSPYADVREPNEPARSALRELIQIAREERRTTFLFVNNRLEGNAPGTIVSILD